MNPINWTLLSAQLFAVAAVVMALCVLRSFYLELKRQAGEQARISMEELVVFVEPTTLFKMNLALLGLVPSATLWITGAWTLAALAAALVLLLPKVWVAWMRRRRRARLIEQLPDTVTMLASSLKAGSSIPLALSLVAQESAPPIAQEFAWVLRAQRLGMGFDEALEALAKRLATEDVDLLVSALVLAKESGGALGNTLDRLATTLRTRANLEGKIRALTAQGKMQGSVMGLLPVALGGALYFLEPLAMQPLFTTTTGWAVVGLIAMLLALGVWMIHRIVTIDP